MGGGDDQKEVCNGEFLAYTFGDGARLLQGFLDFDFCSYGGTSPSSLA
jgi:hypothetical protein